MLHELTDKQKSTLKLLYATNTASSLMDKILEIYQSELKEAKQRSIARSKKLILDQLKEMPSLSNTDLKLGQKDLAAIAETMLPEGIVFE